METKVLHVKLTGTRPLLMHADVLANPMDERTQEHKVLTAKKSSNRTQAEHLEVAKSEWRAGLYYDDEIGPYMPDANIMAALIEGGRRSKLGKALARAVVITTPTCKLEYDGPRDVYKLWEDRRFRDIRTIKQGQVRIPRCRPIFKNWSLQCTLTVDQDEIDTPKVLRSLSDAGAYIGIGDYRPMFGRFEVSEAAA